MTAPTDADRDKALDIIAENQHGDADPFGEIADAIAAALAEERAKARAPFLAEMKPGRWWRVVAADGSLWCETSDEDEARASVRPGDRIERLHEMRVTEWRAAE